MAAHKRNAIKDLGKYSIVELDGEYDSQTFDTVEEWKAGIREWASEGYHFAGLNDLWMGKNFNMIYVSKNEQDLQTAIISRTPAWDYDGCGKLVFIG